MADFAYNLGSKNLWDGTTDILTDTIKVMLVAAGYVANRDNDLVNAGGANDAVDHEISGAGYAAGWGAAGRKTLAGKTITEDDANDRSSFDCNDVTWAGIDVATEPSQLLMIKEGGADDTTSRLITHHDFAVVTNGGDVTAQIADLLRLSTV